MIKQILFECQLLRWLLLFVRRQARSNDIRWIMLTWHVIISYFLFSISISIECKAQVALHSLCQPVGFTHTTLFTIKLMRMEIAALWNYQLSPQLEAGAWVNGNNLCVYTLRRAYGLEDSPQCELHIIISINHRNTLINWRSIVNGVRACVCVRLWPQLRMSTI